MRFASFSPGAILILEMARACAAAGYARIDLGPGEERHKQAFGSANWRLGEGLVETRASLRVAQKALLRAKSYARSSKAIQRAKALQRRVRSRTATQGD